ncbi:MAG: hypothetical protein ACI9C4_003026 [Paraglaciecola sp.]|jgi:hypothetical protein
MKKFEYMTARQRMKNLKGLSSTLALFALAGIYFTWTFSHFELGYLVNVLQNSMLVLGPFMLLTAASVSLLLLLNAYKEKRLPNLHICDEYVLLLDGAIEERVYFADMDSIRLLNCGKRKESIQILLNSGQSITIPADFPIESIKQYLNKVWHCQL